MTAASGQQVVSGTDRPWERAGWILAVPAAGALLAGAWASSVPGGYFEIGIWAALAWLVLGLCWLVTAIVTLVLDVRAARLRQQARRYWRLGLLPALVLVTVILAALDLPARVRFELDRSELEAYAGRVRAGQVDLQQPGPTGRIGTLPVARVQYRDGCVSFVVAGAGFLGQTGYAHCTGAPPDEFGYYVTHVTGPWYTWSYTE